jgi:catechol 2,3-dioxygenase-like lactoylglutathione lyase family enzyme
MAEPVMAEPSTTPRAALGAISPFFIVRDVKQSIAFYCDKLGFETRFEEPAGDPFFAIVGRDSTQIFLKAHTGIAPMPNSTRHPWMRWDAFVYVETPDALAAEFAAKDVAFATPLEDTTSGLHGFELADPDGYILFFGRPLAGS